ncbi:hypothetical protein DERP_006778 [Dermatophagoides pteronyssinus]|uniref:SIS domain-containing protein n=1 Tax=Dermatophagoides pteronyssinus TaxID=6956 RepID=A0ABQ8IRZ6_DERPT|nr:hypothetical protein DERP_006778 [Dermatophagoides pteronyssinus]
MGDLFINGCSNKIHKSSDAILILITHLGKSPTKTVAKTISESKISFTTLSITGSATTQSGHQLLPSDFLVPMTC